MTRIVKDGVVMVARDGNQLAAFLNNGWEACEENQIAENHTKQEEEKKSYTKTEINRLSTDELQALASENGIDGADNMTGTDLKKILLEKFGL